MSRSRTRAGRWVAVLAALVLVSAIGTPIASAQQRQVPGGRPAGRHRRRDQGRRHHHRGGQPDRGRALVGVRRREGVLRVHQRDRRRRLRTRPRAVVGARRPAREQPQRGGGADLPGRRVRRAADRGAAVHGRRQARRGGHPDVRVGHPRGVGFGEQQARPAQPLRQRRFVHLLHLREPERVHLARRRSSASRRSVCSPSTCDQSLGCVAGLENSFKKFKTADVVFADKSITFGSPDYTAQVAEMKERGVDAVIVVHRRQRCGEPGARDGEAAARRASRSCPTRTTHDLVAENADVLEGDYLLHAVRAVRDEPEARGPEALRQVDQEDGRSHGRELDRRVDSTPTSSSRG